MSSKGKPLTQIDRRPSGGSLIDDPITVGLDKSIRIDLSKMPPPANVYDADVAWVEHRPGQVSLFFGKRKRDEESMLRTRLEVRYPPENLVRHFWGNSRAFHKTMADYAAKWPKDQTRDNVDPAKWKAEKEHSEWANFEAIAHAGTEASMDFYRLPPSGIAQFAKGHGSAGLKFTGVVRVQLTIFELLRLLDDVGQVVSVIEEYLPSSDKEGEPVEAQA